MFKKKRTEINLLPESQRIESLQERIIFSGIIILASLILIAVAFGFNFWQSTRIKQIDRKLHMLETQGKTEVEKTAELISQTKNSLSIYKQFQLSYPDLTQRLSIIEENIPANLFLVAAAFNKNNHGEFSGQADNPLTISDFVSNLEKERDIIDSVEVTNVSKSKEGYSFSLNISFK